MLGQAVTGDPLLSLPQMFAFSRWSRGNWETRRPAPPLAEAGPQRLHRWLRIRQQGSAAAFLVWTGRLQKSEELTCTVRSVQLLQRQRLGGSWLPVNRAQRISEGGTHSALCLSSARIWSLGFRLYLQRGKKTNKRHYHPTYIISTCE